jgi:hypothetical protein
MVIVLGNVVENGTAGFFEYLLDRMPSTLRPRDIVVCEVQIGLMVFRYVDLDRVRGQKAGNSSGEVR